MKFRKEAYTSASTLPVKLLRYKDQCISNEGILNPVHVQYNPTNKCNLSCEFCSCKDRDKGMEIPLDLMSHSIETFTAIGMKAVTITGGGEPLMYSHLDPMVHQLRDHNVEVGLVTNGLLLGKSRDIFSMIKWCRISVSDDRDVEKLIWILVHSHVLEFSVDWAFSYVITKDLNLWKLIDIIKFANTNNFTHVRLVSDLMNLNEVPTMLAIKEKLSECNVDVSRVIFQGRKLYEQGMEKCNLSLLKPVVGADGWVYPCCGIQYALPKTSRDYPLEARMCHLSEISKYFAGQKPFNGIHCNKCYYSDYNRVLEAYKERYEHGLFV